MEKFAEFGARIFSAPYRLSGSPEGRSYLLCCGRQQDRESCSCAEFAFHRDFAVMTFDDGFDDEKPEPGTFGVRSATEPVKFRKQGGDFVSGYSYAGVLDLDGDTLVDALRFHRDGAAGGRKLDGVADQVPQCALQLRGISHDRCNILIELELQPEVFLPGCD